MNKSKIIANQLIESMNTQFQKNIIDDGFLQLERYQV